MRSYLITLIAIFIFQNTYSQCNKDKKLLKIYEKENFDKLKQKADASAKKNKKDAFPYFLVTQKAIEEYKQSYKIKYLNTALLYARKATVRDKKKICNNYFSSVLDSLRSTTEKKADSLYDAQNKDQSEFYYRYLAQIYGDTTTNYRNILYPKVLQTEQSTTQAQRDLQKIPKSELKNTNKFDTNGKRTGLWIKFYNNGSPAYIVRFKDGKPIGEYLRYHENGARKARLVYDEKGYAMAQLFDEDTTLLAIGKYAGINKDSVWTYFYKNGKPAARYVYSKGRKNGRSYIYYPDGTVLEELDWQNDKKSGIWRQYYPSGKIRMECKYLNDERNGAFHLFYENGIYDTKGYYKNDLREDTWEYYDKFNHLLKKEFYRNGKLPIENKIDSLETELKIQEDLFKLAKSKNKSVEEIQKINANIQKIKAELKKLEILSPDEKENQELKYLDKKLPASEDPMNYINNPEQFIKHQQKNN